MRASRTDLWWVLISGIFCICIIGSIEYGIAYGNEKMDGRYPMYVSLICLIWWIFILLKTIINRFHDLNKSGWRILGFVFPPLAVGVIFELLFSGGTKGSNNYGKYKNIELVPTYNNKNLQQPKTIPTYNPQNFELKKSLEKPISTQNTNIPTIAKTSYDKKIDQINNSSKTYQKKPNIYKSSGDYNPYSLSGK